ncbi:MAG: MmgE/PrpD family protein [Clostridiales bacterium]|jgi:2-methylcitrate dehydratase PrpD|nr:MmgE/PrpD family protein [Clostridiales bacterium]
MSFHLFDTGKEKTNYTEQLCRFIHDLKYEDIPPEVVERAKMIAMQTIGASLAANGIPLVEKAVSLGKRCGGEGGEATIWIDGSKTSIPGAVFCNSTLADALDWEDCAWTGHPSAGIVPVALACSEALNKSGKEFLTAIVAGYEVYTRIAMAVQPPEDWPNYKGWGLTAWQIFAAVVPAAKLLGLDVNKINQAIGFGVTSCPIPQSFHQSAMSDAYHYEHGFRSMEGVMCAFNAEAGISNYMNALDDPWAFENHVSTEPDNSWYTKDLGSRWLIMETLLKHWPANMWIQTPLELTDMIMTENNITKDDIAEIIIDPPTYLRMAYYPEGYTSLTQAQFSMPFMLASYILDPTPSSKWLREEKLKDKELLAIAAKVKSGPSEPILMPSAFKNFQKGRHPVITVTIKTNDGKEYSEIMEKHLGHPGNMMTEEQFKDRFRVQASACMSGERLEQTVELLANVDDCPDMAEVAKLLHK